MSALCAALLACSSAFAEEAPSLKHEITPVTFLKSDWNAQAEAIFGMIAGDEVRAALGFAPSIAIETSPAPWAYANKRGEVVVSSGMLLSLQSTSEYAFLLAHELAHFMLHHQDTRERPDGPLSLREMMQQELEADELALGMLRNAGLDPQASVSLLRRLGTPLGLTEKISMASLYPSLKIRVERLQKLLSTPLRGSNIS